MSPRDPAQLARIAPEAQALVNTLDALYALLEAAEGCLEEYGYVHPDRRNGATPSTLALHDHAHHARACWDNLVHREPPEEREANARIDRLLEGEDSTPADPTRTRGGTR